jgi:hypothetical protein
MLAAVRARGGRVVTVPDPVTIPHDVTGGFAPAARHPRPR